jgi:hypothetical protein
MASLATASVETGHAAITVGYFEPIPFAEEHGRGKVFLAPLDVPLS